MAGTFVSAIILRKIEIKTSCKIPPRFKSNRGETFSSFGPAPGRPKKGETRDKAQDYRDECERVEVERRFSLAKRKCGMGLVTAKLRETAAHVIAMSVLVLNLRKIQRALLRMLAYLLEILAQNKNWALVQWTLVRPLETGVVGHKSYILLFSYSSIFRVQMKFYCF